ncbi:YdcF family protein [Candidatus Woesearchaeota archaeon]|nr:YdcF family protein [Candidatus Woesearchaeota archaeon]
MKFDAIIVLGAAITDKGNLSRIARSRVEKAIELFRYLYAPRIIMTGKRESLAMRKYATKRGLPRKCAFAEDHSLDTIGNAFFARKLFLEPNGWNKVVVVTSKFHARRAEFIFRKVLGRGYFIKVIPSRRVLSEKLFRLKLQSERKTLLVTKMLGSLIADGDLAAIENFLRKSPIYRR